jgi:hypothetical protein
VGPQFKYVSFLLSWSRLVTFYEAASEQGFSASSHMENGWIFNGYSEMLFWVPPWSRECLWRPNNVTVVGRRLTKLDLGYFVCGTSWEQCMEPIAFPVRTEPPWITIDLVCGRHF